MFKPRASIIAIAAIMIAVTTVCTLLVRVPIPATQGYVNFSDVATYLAGFTFGPWIGFIAGGIGAGLADILGGYAQFAVVTLFAHGLQGLVAGALGRGKKLPGMILAWLGGTAAMIGIYLVGEALLLRMGWGPALAEVPPNLLQNVVGGLIGIPLFYAVRKAYPPITRMGQPSEWTEG